MLGRGGKGVSSVVYVRLRCFTLLTGLLREFEAEKAVRKKFQRRIRPSLRSGCLIFVGSCLRSFVAHPLPGAARRGWCIPQRRPVYLTLRGGPYPLRRCARRPQLRAADASLRCGCCACTGQARPLRPRGLPLIAAVLMAAELPTPSFASLTAPKAEAASLPSSLRSSAPLARRPFGRYAPPPGRYAPRSTPLQLPLSKGLTSRYRRC